MSVSIVSYCRIMYAVCVPRLTSHAWFLRSRDDSNGRSSFQTIHAEPRTSWFIKYLSLTLWLVLHEHNFHVKNQQNMWIVNSLRINNSPKVNCCKFCWKLNTTVSFHSGRCQYFVSYMYISCLKSISPSHIINNKMIHAKNKRVPKYFWLVT